MFEWKGREDGRLSGLATQSRTQAVTFSRFNRRKLIGEVGNHPTTLEELETMSFL